MNNRTIFMLETALLAIVAILTIGGDLWFYGLVQRDNEAASAPSVAVLQVVNTDMPTRSPTLTRTDAAPLWGPLACCVSTTPTPTDTPAATFTASNSPTPTDTLTATFTPTHTPTPTATSLQGRSSARSHPVFRASLPVDAPQVSGMA